MLKRLSLHSQRLTLINKSPVEGLTWRQFKSTRAWIKRNKKRLGSRSISAVMQHHDQVRRIADSFFPRKHYWD